MHLYQNGTVPPDAVSAYLNHRSDGTPFAVVRLGRDAALHLLTPADCDALIAAVVEAKRLLDPPAPQPCGEKHPGDGAIACSRPKDHEGWHVGDPGGDAWEPPVITDSERTCDQANPETGAWCHRGGDHGVHRDTDGAEWRTDTVGGLLLPGDCDPDGEPEAAVCGDRGPGRELCTRPAGHPGGHKAGRGQYWTAAS